MNAVCLEGGKTNQPTARSMWSRCKAVRCGAYHPTRLSYPNLKLINSSLHVFEVLAWVPQSSSFHPGSLLKVNPTYWLLGNPSSQPCNPAIMKGMGSSDKSSSNRLIHPAVSMKLWLFLIKLAVPQSLLKVKPYQLIYHPVIDHGELIIRKETDWKPDSFLILWAVESKIWKIQ